MKINRKVFYDEIRQNLFGKLEQEQVDGMETILNEWELRDLTDLRWLAYMLATTYHETDQKMQPIEEYGKGDGHAYGKPDQGTGKIYYGRGLAQLTHKRNYQLFSDRLGLDLVNKPELALQTDVAVKILFDGMVAGLFTGVGLPKYLGQTTDWINARRVVNGLDKANIIAKYAEKFDFALIEATDEYPPVELPPTPSLLEPTTTVEKKWWNGKKTHMGMLISGLIGVAAMLGYIPGMTADQGADMLQTAFGVSGFRSAMPSLIKMAISFYLVQKNELQ